MELRQLEYFAAVVRNGHFGRAAQDVFVTQSALSQQIRRLEEELGLALLLRTGRGVQLTPAGREFLAHAEAILGQVAQARATIDDHLQAVRGVARVAATPYDSRRLPGALIAFHREHPGVQLALRHTSATAVADLVIRGAVDVGIAGLHDAGAELPDTVRPEIIGQERLRLIGPAGSSFAGRVDLNLEELRGRPVILPEPGTALRRLICTGCEQAGFSPLPLLETSDPHTVRQLAAAGLAVSALPASWLQEPGAEVATGDFADPAPIYRVALLSRGDGRLPVRELLVDHLIRFFTGP